MPVRLTLDAQAFRRRRVVVLRSGDRVLARWVIEPLVYQTYQTGPIHLPGGIQELVLESDGDDGPVSVQQVPDAQDLRPFSLRVSGIALEPCPGEETRPVIAAEPGTAGRLE